VAPSQQPSAPAAPESPHRQPSPLKQLLRRSSEALARISSMRSSGSGTGGDSPQLGSPRRTRTSRWVALHAWSMMNECGAVSQKL
jgi:hypothetical protein